MIFEGRTSRPIRIALLAFLCANSPSILHAQIRVTGVRPAPNRFTTNVEALPNASKQSMPAESRASLPVDASPDSLATASLRMPVALASRSLNSGMQIAPKSYGESNATRVRRVWLVANETQGENPAGAANNAQEHSNSGRLPAESLPPPPKEAKQADRTTPVPTILQDVDGVPIDLTSLIRFSLISRRIFNSLSGGVVIEGLTAYDPQIAAQQIIAEASKFDPSVSSAIAGNHVDLPPSSFFGPGLQENTLRDEAEFIYRLSKIWPTGLASSIGYEPSLAYLFFPAGTSSGFNPAHSSDLVVRAVQPLLQGGSKQANLATLRIAERRLMQNKLQIESTVQRQLRSIEQAYWTLHANHVRLKAIDEAIVLAKKTVELVQLRFEAQRTIYADVARAQVKLEDLYQQRLGAELDIRKSSFDLAQLVGLEFGEDRILIPIDNPENRPPQFESSTIIATAINFNPDLLRQRQEVEIRRTAVVAAENQMLPKLDLLGTYRSSGLDASLGDSLRQMVGVEYNNYSLGLQYSQQFGLRLGKSRVQSAKLDAARVSALQTALERQVGFDILKSLSQLELSYSRYESALRQLSQAQKWVELAQIRYEDPPLQGSGQESLLLSLADYQTALQSRIDALVLVANAIAEYNVNLAIIEEKRGTMLARWNITTLSDADEFLQTSPVVPASGIQSP